MQNPKAVEPIISPMAYPAASPSSWRATPATMAVTVTNNIVLKRVDNPSTPLNLYSSIFRFRYSFAETDKLLNGF